MLASPDPSPQIFFSALFGLIVALIAASRGRNPVGWFFIGAFTACIGLVLVLVLPNLKEEQALREQQELENRRLREQLAKERQVSDQRHGDVQRRLAAHDGALGIDTSSPPELEVSPAEPAAPAALPPAGTRWFYARGKERLGPVTSETILHLRQAGVITDETLVWRDEMPDWAPLRDTELHGHQA